HAAPTGVGGGLQAGAAETALVIAAQLLVIDAFARVVEQGIGCYRAWVGAIACPGLAQRVFGVVLFQAAENQVECAVVVRRKVEFGEGLVAAGGAVVAVAVGVQARGVEYKTDAIGFAFRAEAVARQAVAAEQGFDARTRAAATIPGKHLDDAAGVAAVQRRRGT